MILGILPNLPAGGWFFRPFGEKVKHNFSFTELQAYDRGILPN
jgi:hypothetical protein